MNYGTEKHEPEMFPGEGRVWGAGGNGGRRKAGVYIRNVREKA
jgi:hypothetical protein